MSKDLCHVFEGGEGLQWIRSMISLICREMFSYSKVQEEVLKLLTSSIEFAKTQDFITYIMNEGCDMQQAVEQLNTRKTDLMTECAIVFAGKSIYVAQSLWTFTSFAACLVFEFDRDIPKCLTTENALKQVLVTEPRRWQ